MAARRADCVGVVVRESPPAASESNEAATLAKVRGVGRSTFGPQHSRYIHKHTHARPPCLTPSPAPARPPVFYPVTGDPPSPGLPGH